MNSAARTGPVAVVDLDDTLLNYRYEEDFASALLQRALSVPEDIWRAAYVLAKQKERALRPGTDPSVWMRRRFEILFEGLDRGTLGGPTSPGDAEAMYIEARLSAVRELPGARELLTRIQAAGARTFIATVGPASLQRRRLEVAGLASLVEVMLASRAEVPTKANLDLFLRPVRWSLKPDTAWMISDQVDPDLVEARKMGMRCAHILQEAGSSQSIKFAPDLSAANPRELSGAVEKMFPLER